MARLASIGRFSIAWFGSLSLVLVSGLIGAGYWMFSARTASGLAIAMDAFVLFGRGRLGVQQFLFVA